MKSVAKIKRSFSLLLVFCMLMAAVVPAVYAQGSTVKLKVNSVEAKPGQEVEVSIELTENPGIWGLDFGVAYDSEVLTLKKCEDKGLLPDKLHGEDLSANPYILSWMNSADEDTTGTGTLVVLTFEVSETAADNSETKIEINEPTAPSWVETAERPVVVTNGTVTIKAAPVVNEYTVTFNSNGGSAVASQKVKDGETATKPADPTRTGFTFKGWYSDAGLTSAFNFNTAITKDTTLYAKWEENAVVNEYTVTFNSNGGSAVASQKVKDGETATKPADPTRTGFTFKGWYSDAGLTSAFNFNTAITKDTTLYAKWEKVSPEDPATEDPATEDPATEDPATEDPATEDPATEDPATEDPATEDPATEDPATEDPATEDPATETPGTLVERFFGKDRILTAIALSKKYIKADSVVIAHARKYPDALTASVLAYALDGPILLTDTGIISADVLAELDRLGVSNIYVVGGINSVSDDVAQSYAEGRTMTRLGGADRYATAGLVADKVTELEGTKGMAFIASGENYPDALAVSSPAAQSGAPILLVQKDSLPEDTQNAMTRNGIVKTMVIGGENSISEEVEKALPDVQKRLEGKDRYETAHAVAKHFNAKASVAFLASGEVFADALSAGPMAAKKSAPMLLTPKAELKPATLTYLKEAGVNQVTVVGGPDSVSNAVLRAIK